MLISLSNVSKLFQNGQFPICQPILAAIFVTKEMVKVKLILDIYTWDINQINRTNLIKSIFYFLALYEAKLAL